ncbi:MAG TPA: glycosyltransferase family 87 protein [Bacteroidales bacterium]
MDKIDFPRSEHLGKFFFSKRGVAFSFVLLFLILTVFMVQMYGKAYRANGNDFSSYMLSARIFLDGHSPYQTGSHFPFIYPLLLCVILGPFSMMPYWLLNLLWFLGSVLALYFVGDILVRHYSPAFTHAAAGAVFIVPFLVLVNVIQSNLLNGQVNFIVLLLCTLFLRDYLLSRNFTASLFLSMAIAIKVMPLILLVYLLCRRDFLMVGLVIFMTLILSFGVPYIIGGAATFGYYSSYWHSFIMDHIAVNGQMTHGFAFSLTSILGFFIPSIPKLFTFIIAGILSLAPIILIQLVSRREKSTEKEILIFSLYMMAILLISPLSETHHLINLFPALSVLVVAMLQYSRRHFKIGALVLVTVFGSLIFGKFYFAANIIAIITLYSSMLWLILQNKMHGQS